METAQILRQMHLLVADDCHQSNATLYKLFSDIFGQVSLANDGAAALACYQKDDIDIVISDICMPGQDGLTFAENIRQKDPYLPILILTAHTDKDYLLRAANLRLDGYLVKPLNFTKLNAALERVVHYLEHRLQPVGIAQNVHYNPLIKCLQVDGEEVLLGNKERCLLELLVYKREVVGKQEIYEKVWPDGGASEPALKNLLSELRKKLKYDLIKNRHGIGWVLERRTANAPD